LGIVFIARLRPLYTAVPDLPLLEEALENETERKLRLAESLREIHAFRNEFSEFQKIRYSLAATLPDLLTKLYSDCQCFAEGEINSLLERF
jgi:hypothetical protein